jgi:peptidoglycan/LPS O-acetylase OafA/YrhL
LFLPVAFLCGGLAIHQSVWPYSDTPINSLDIGYYLPTFVLGVALAVTTRHGNFKISDRSATASRLLVTFVIIISTPGTRHILFGIPLRYQLPAWFIHFGLLWSIFIASSLDKESFGKLSGCGAFRGMGAWSYPIYLFH